MNPRPSVVDYDEEIKPILNGFGYDDEENPRSNISEKPNTKPFHADKRTSEINTED